MSDRIPSNVVDGLTSSAAVTAPWWLAYLHGAMQELMLIGGFVLLVLRIVIAVKELREKRKAEGRG